MKGLFRGRAVCVNTTPIDSRFFVGKYFVVRLSTTKTTKTLPPEKYPLYSSYLPVLFRTSFRSGWTPPTPPPEGKFPHRRMQRFLPAEVSAEDESLKSRRRLVSGVDPRVRSSPLIISMTINLPSVVRPDPHCRLQPS